MAKKKKIKKEEKQTVTTDFTSELIKSLNKEHGRRPCAASCPASLLCVIPPMVISVTDIAYTCHSAGTSTPKGAGHQSTPLGVSAFHGALRAQRVQHVSI